LQGLMGIVKPLTDILADHPSIVRAIAAAYAAWKVAEFASSLGSLVSGLDIGASLLGLFGRNTRAATGLTVAHTAALGTNTAAVVANRTVIDLLGVSMGRYKSVLAATTATNSAAAVSNLYHVGMLTRLKDAATGLLPVLTRVKVFMTGLGGAATLGLGTGLFAANSILTNASSKAAEFKAANEDAFNFDQEKMSLNDWRDRINALGEEYNRLYAEQERGDGFFGQGLQFGQELNPFAGNSIREAGEQAAAIEPDLRKAQRAMESAIGTVNSFAKGAGISGEAAEHLADVMGIDVTMASGDLKKALAEAWHQTKVNGEENKILAGALGISEQAYERLTKQIQTTTGSLDALERSGGSSNRAQVFSAFEQGADSLSAMPERLAPIIEQLNQQVESFLSPIQAWGGAMATVESEIAEKHNLFIEDLRSQYDAWISKHQESNVSFDEWAANINGVSFEQFATSFDKPKMAFTQMMEDMEKNLTSFREWSNNVKTIAERGGADLALEIAQWGPEAAPLVAEIANSTKPEFEKFSTLMTDTMSASTDAMIYELGLMQVIGGEMAGATVADVEKALGLMPGDVAKIAEETKTDFDEIMQAMAILAKEDGEMTAEGLAEALSDTLGDAYPGILSLIQSYIDLFADLGYQIDTAASQMNNFNNPDAWTFDHDNNPATPPLRVSADGNIFKAFAGGGVENHVAQIAPAGAMRLWAEPETGGEAYIPLSRGKRGRSMAILSEVARMFGAQLHVPGQSYASGGVSGGSGGGFGVAAVPVHIEVNVFGKASAEDADEVVKALVEWSRSNGAIPIRVNG
jgi:hypothetical protein